MQKALLILFAALCLTGCPSPTVRPDPFAAPEDTGDLSLHVAGCAQSGVSVGCALGPSDRFDAVLWHTLTPFSGTLDVVGCNGQWNLPIPSAGEFNFKLPDFASKECIFDLTYNWRLPANFDSELPVRAMRAKIYALRLDSGAAASTWEWGSREQVGVGTYRQLVNPPSGTVQTPLFVRFSKAAASGYFQLFGCGMGIKALPFSGSQLGFTSIELFGPNPPRGDCMLFGWAVSPDGLNDEFALGLTVHADTEPVALALTHPSGKVCFTADPHVTMTAYGAATSNKLSDCFKQTASTLVGAFTIKGRAAYAEVQ